MNKEGLSQHPTSPVQLICGAVDGKMPTVSELLKKNREQYGRPGPLAYNAGFKPTKRQGENLPTFMDGCTAPVFLVPGHGYFYPLDREGEINEFLESKKEKV